MYWNEPKNKIPEHVNFFAAIRLIHSAGQASDMGYGSSRLDTILLQAVDQLYLEDGKNLS